MNIEEFSEKAVGGRLKDLTASAIAVYAVIIAYYHARRPVPSFHEVANASGLSIRTVFRAVRELRARGIEVERCR